MFPRPGPLFRLTWYVQGRSDLISGHRKPFVSTLAVKVVPGGNIVMSMLRPKSISLKACVLRAPISCSALLYSLIGSLYTRAGTRCTTRLYNGNNGTEQRTRICATDTDTRSAYQPYHSDSGMHTASCTTAIHYITAVYIGRYHRHVQ